VLAAFAVVMLAAMIAMPGEETIPYHLMFLSITLVYGFRVWPMRPTVLVVAAITASTGAVLYMHYLDHRIDGPELSEVPLMPLLLLAMMWHARRRAAAQRQVEQMAEERHRSLEREREFLRDASHAIRTPVTIARGHVELMQTSLDDPTAYEDSEVVLRQLDRMHALSSRLLALARLDSAQDLRLAPVDLDAFVAQTAANWTGSADRDWVVVTGGGRVGADREWLELAVDAIVENAVHFTEPGDRVELSCWREQNGMSTIAITDSGAGIPAAHLPHVFERFWHRRPPGGMPGSGLGLAMAMAAANAMGGSLTVSSTLGRGTRFMLSLPNAR
jgi:signal transduction histidine kinase